MVLNDWQKAVARTYGDRDYAHFDVDGAISDDDLDQCGDTLFVFLMLELSDAEDCDSSEEAIRRMESARRQLDDTIEALGAPPRAT
jgi:hypothetical protein